MGQYYNPTNITKKQWIYTHDYKETYTREDGSTYTIGQGLKLMEHSYVGNPIMMAVENAIIPGGKWYKDKLVWAGDYADEEPDTKSPRHEDGQNIYHLIGITKNKRKLTPKQVDPKFHFLTNHTKKQVIDMTTLKEDKDGYTIHPLSLLVCEGNGRGGGDFIGTDERIGTWARDSISLEETLSNGYTLVDGNFVEER